MFRSLLSCFSFFVFVNVAFAGFDVPSLQRKFGAPATNNGPNCYNTTLVALGYMDELVHVSPEEAEFYVSSFCKLQNIKADIAPNGMIVVYGKNSEFDHMASLLGNGQTFEKYNFLGSQSSGGRPLPDGFHGDYVFHPLSESYVYQRAMPEDVRVFLCEPAKDVFSALAVFNQSAWKMKNDSIRSELARDIQKISAAKIGAFLNFRGAGFAQELETILEIKPANQRERAFQYVGVLSNYRQLYYLYEQGSCRDCDRVDLEDFQLRMKDLNIKLQQFSRNL